MSAQEDHLVIYKLHTLGHTIAQIVRELRLDRKTVRRHLRQGQPPEPIFQLPIGCFYRVVSRAIGDTF